MPERGVVVVSTPSTRPRTLGWRIAAPVTVIGAGLLFALSATTARGTDLRASRSDLATLVSQQRTDVQGREQVAAQWRRQVAAATRTAAAGDSTITREQAGSAKVAAAAGLTPVTGRGLVVALDDAPTPLPGIAPASDNPDDLVIHQQDLQAVVNALWAGGADAMTLMGERVISTSAVRCVGNTVILHGRVFGPPFVVAAIGDPEAMRASLDAEPGVILLRQYVRQAGVRLSVKDSPGLRLPAYDGPLDLTHVQAGP